MLSHDHWEGLGDTTAPCLARMERWRQSVEAVFAPSVGLTSGCLTVILLTYTLLLGFAIKLQLPSSPVELSDKDLAHELTVFVSGVSDQAQVIETLMVCWSFRKGP